ncbi:MAG TPA: uroporphyrinogen-III C-methyltransferase [Acidimicrobiales bacterium]|nr:uroporphyrinogen-III C-methyltransferase [Acidimicrobiales bacterium]
MTVYLVGAGPGDPGLMTVRAAQILAGAEVVVHDRLADARILSGAPAAARLIDVGKAPGGPVRQEEINDLLVAEGRAGRSVVRLKGGDPFVFGRGGEEALALRAAGVPFEVVPGVTSAVAVPAYAGVPVTHRGLATSFTVVTGHSRHAVDRETNWEALAAAGGSIVVLMGVTHRRRIAERLIAGGLDPATPVAAVHWGTRPEQVTVRVRLDQLADTPLDPPVTMVIGAVAGLDLDWYETRPLFGRRVVVTRARAQASELARRLGALGARVVEAPTIRIDPPGDGGAGLDRAAAALRAGAYRWIVFTSANAVDALMARVPDARRLGGVSLAAVGPATAAALQHYRLVADLVPERQEAAGLLAAFPAPHSSDPFGMAPSERRVLFPRAAEGREVLVDGLAGKGWQVDLVEAYRTVPAPADDGVRAEVGSADAVCFSASSTVTGFLASYGPAAVPPVVVCIGPVTADTARAAGLAVTAVADSASVDGLVDAVVSVLHR